MRLGRSSAMYFHFLRARMLPAADCHAWPPEAARRGPPLRLRGPRVPAEISHRHRSGWGWCSSAHRRDIISAPSKFQMHIKLCGSRTKFKNCCEKMDAPNSKLMCGMPTGAAFKKRYRHGPSKSLRKSRVASTNEMQRTVSNWTELFYDWLCTQVRIHWTTNKAKLTVIISLTWKRSQTWDFTPPNISNRYHVRLRPAKPTHTIRVVIITTR